jgi:lipoprotein-anchoring transpeptidase ErfK/SrfK
MDVPALPEEKPDRHMVKMDSLALAAGLALLLIAGSNGAFAQNAQPTAPAVSGTVIKPSSTASAVSKPISVEAAKPAITAASPAPAAKPTEVKVPAPSMTLPATPPVVATAPKQAAPAAAAQQASAPKPPVPAATAPATQAAKPVMTAKQQASAPAAKAAAAMQPGSTTKPQDQKQTKPASATAATAKPAFPVAAAKTQPGIKAGANEKAADAAKPAKPGQKVANAAAKSAKPGEEDGKPVKKVKAGAGKEAEKNAKEKQAKDKQAKDKQAPKNQAPVVQAKLDEGGVVIRQTPKFFFGLFDAPKPEMESLSEEQVEHDQKLAAVPEKKRFKVKEEFVPVTVPFKGYKPGTIVIDTKEKYLYFVESPISAIRYAVAVGKEGLLFTGKATVGAKQPWPRWIPTKEMIERDPAKYGKYLDGMEGGPDNPLGARAIYLYQGKQDTYLRIHGTNQPQSIGTASSNGCFRMINEHVIDLYKRVELGAEVVVM